jgi:hypothetical protein
MAHRAILEIVLRILPRIEGVRADQLIFCVPSVPLVQVILRVSGDSRLLIRVFSSFEGIVESGIIGELIYMLFMRLDDCRLLNNATIVFIFAFFFDISMILSVFFHNYTCRLL